MYVLQRVTHSLPIYSAPNNNVFYPTGRVQPAAVACSLDGVTEVRPIIAGTITVLMHVVTGARHVCPAEGGRWCVHILVLLIARNVHALVFYQRCDGQKPICGPCVTKGRADDCEYPSDVQGLTRTQLLEENIAILEARIREMENPEESTSIRLHDYQGNVASGSGSSSGQSPNGISKTS